MKNRRVNEKSKKQELDESYFTIINNGDSYESISEGSVKINGSTFITSITIKYFYPNRDNIGIDSKHSECFESKLVNNDNNNRNIIKQFETIHETSNIECTKEEVSAKPNVTNLTPGISDITSDVKWNKTKAFTRPTIEEAPSIEPCVVYTTYKDDLNIFKIHDAIRYKYCYKLSKVSEQKEKIKNQLAILNDKENVIILVERNMCIQEIKKAIKDLHKLTSFESWDNYIDLVKPILTEYSKLISHSEFEGVEINETVVDKSIVINDLSLAKQIVIHKFLMIASTQIEIHAFSSIKFKNSCIICGLDAENSTFSDDHGTYVCKCGRETIGVAKIATFRDSARIDIGIKNSYEDLANFIKRIDAFEGKQRTQPPSILYDQLEEYFEKHPLKCGKTPQEIRDSPLLPNGKKEGTSISILADALLNTLNSAFYRDSELIAHNFWGWSLADLSINNLRKIIINDYIETQKVYEEIKERESSLNVNLRLFFHLRARDYPCVISDFKVVSSRDSLEYHQKMMKEMCERTGLKFTPVI